MKYLMIFVLCSFTTVKLILQSRFGKKMMNGFGDTVAFNSVVFTVAALLFLKNALAASAGVWSYAAGFAFFTVLFQLSYTKALAVGNVSLTVMIVNLGMLFPVFLSAFWFHEQISVLRGVGIVLTVASFVLCVERRKEDRTRADWFLYAVLALIGNGCLFVVQKLFGESALASSKEAFVSCSFLVASCMTYALLGGWKLRKGKAEALKKPKFWLIAVAVGVILSVFQVMNTHAIATIDGTLMFPAYAGGSILLSTLVGVLLFRDRLNKKQIAGMITGAVAIVLVNM